MHAVDKHVFNPLFAQNAMCDGTQADRRPPAGTKRKSPFDVSEPTYGLNQHVLGFNVIEEMIRKSAHGDQAKKRWQPLPLAHSKHRVRQPGDFVLLDRSKNSSHSTPETVAKRRRRTGQPVARRRSVPSMGHHTAPFRGNECVDAYASNQDSECVELVRDAEQLRILGVAASPVKDGKRVPPCSTHANATTVRLCEDSVADCKAESTDGLLWKSFADNQAALDSTSDGGVDIQLHSGDTCSASSLQPFSANAGDLVAKEESEDGKTVPSFLNMQSGYCVKRKARRWSRMRTRSHPPDKQPHGREFDRLHRDGSLRKHLWNLERDGLYLNALSMSQANSAAQEKELPQEISDGKATNAPNSVVGRTPCGYSRQIVTADNVIHLAQVAPAMISAPVDHVSRCDENASNAKTRTVCHAAEIDAQTTPASAATSSSSQHGSVRRSRRLSRRNDGVLKFPEVIDLTLEENRDSSLSEISSKIDDLRIGSEGASPRKTDNRELVQAKPSVRENELTHVRESVEVSYVEPQFLKPLSDEEIAIVKALTQGRCSSEPLATIPHAGITLRREDFRRLRNVRWLNDEVINAYVALINQRNQWHFQSKRGVAGEVSRRPRTYVFSTYFHTRLVSSGYDYPGVSRWTRKANVDILQKDLVLVPVNLGNNHWILSGVDMYHRQFLYLDSMHGPDSAKVLHTLKRWLYDEVLDKHGIEQANKLSVDTWGILNHRYFVFCDSRKRDDTLSAPPVVASNLKRIPLQRDGGSCGVFTAKIADCLELGLEIYFTHANIRLVRQRMALDLYRRVLPG